MDGHLRLSAKERKTCLSTYRAARQARRALILLLLAEGRSYREIAAAALASPTMIRAVKKDWETGRTVRVLGTEERSFVVAWWLIVVVRWLLTKTPQDFGFFRTRWSCALLAMLLWEEENMRLSPETVRRGLARMEFVWRRSWGRGTRFMPRNSAEFSGSSPTCRRTRRSCSRTRSTST